MRGIKHDTQQKRFPMRCEAERADISAKGSAEERAHEQHSSWAVHTLSNYLVCAPQWLVRCASAGRCVHFARHVAGVGRGEKYEYLCQFYWLRGTSEAGILAKRLDFLSWHG